MTIKKKYDGNRSSWKSPLLLGKYPSRNPLIETGYMRGDTSSNPTHKFIGSINSKKRYQIGNTNEQSYKSFGDPPLAHTDLLSSFL